MEEVRESLETMYERIVRTNRMTADDRSDLEEIASHDAAQFDIMPGALCTYLGVASGSDYRQGAQALLDRFTQYAPPLMKPKS